jgi:hypothetical protein
MVYKAKDGTDKSIVTVGDKWANFQIEISMLPRNRNTHYQYQ